MSDKICSSLHRRAGMHRGCSLCQTVLSSIVRFVQGAYVYVMITNWFQLLSNAAIQLPSGPSVNVFGVCMCLFVCVYVRVRERE